MLVDRITTVDGMILNLSLGQGDVGLLETVTALALNPADAISSSLLPSGSAQTASEPQETADDDKSPRKQRREPPHAVGREDSVVRKKALRAKPNSRRRRRYENGCFIQTLARQLGVTAEEASDTRTMLPAVHSPSVFTGIIDDAEALQDFHDNVEMPEHAAEKHALLIKRGNASKKGNVRRYDIGANEQPLSATERYVNIDRDIRSVLKMRNTDLEFLSALEALMKDAFLSNPDTTVVNREESPYHRLLMHGVAQYLCLSSYSKDLDGERLTIVSNRRKTFILPSTPLSAFLQGQREYTAMLDATESTTISTDNPGS